ncbi:MarR family transcriptional regulator [Ruminococcaceae bacterium OttesenSCG-928-A16]|nr:MarR family transcriptional regulator [Ruminococcaceae bacterium OttesenSCG-928-A16]
MHFKGIYSYSGEYAAAVGLFEQMDKLRRVWAGFHPMPPFKRSDLAMLGTIDRMLNHGEKKVTVSMLARQLQQSMPGVSQKITLLEEKGYVKREGDKADRRVIYIELTNKGKEVAHASLGEFLGRIESALNMMGEEKTNQLLALMQELSTAIETVQQQNK